MINDEQLHQWINNTISPEDLEVFKKRPEYDSLVALYKNTEDLAGPSFDSEAMLQNILTSPKEEKTQEQKPIATRRKIIPQWLKYGIAASALLLAGFFLWPHNQWVSYEVAKNEQLKGKLPDLSEFVLNAESKLTYNKKNWDDERNIDLEGEAFFKVQKGATFKVNTSVGTVEVLGTHFNVKARTGFFEVSCTEGKVAVTSNKNSKQEVLNAGQFIRVKPDGSIERKENESENAKRWITGVTQLSDVTVAELIAELERQFDIQIEAKGINLTTKISCNFQHKNLDTALQTATFPLADIQYKIVHKNKVMFLPKK